MSCVGLGFQLHMCRLALGPPGLKWGKYSYRATYDMCNTINVFGCYRVDNMEEPWEPLHHLDQPPGLFYVEWQWYFESSQAKANRYLRAGGCPPFPPLPESDQPTFSPIYQQKPQQVRPQTPSSSSSHPSGLQVPFKIPEHNHQPDQATEAHWTRSQEPTRGLPRPGAKYYSKSRVDASKKDNAPEPSENPGARSKAASQAGPPVPPTQHLPGLTSREILQAFRKIPWVRSFAGILQTLSDPGRRNIDVEEFFRVVQTSHPDKVSPDIPLRVMWNLGYACADSSNEQRPDNDNNPAGSICRRRRFRMCCACGDHHAAWDCASTRESRVPVNKLWAWPCAPPTGWDTMKQQKLKYWLSRMCHDTMRRPLYGDEMPLPTPDYFLDGNNSAGDSPQLPPERFAEPHGTPGFVRNLAAKTSNHSRPLVSRSASHTSTLYQRPPSPSGNHQTSPRGPRTAGSLRGGCRPTQMTTTPAIRTFRARQLHSAQPFQGSQTFQQTPSQLLLGQNST
jgi:hypothetical protein